MIITVTKGDDINDIITVLDDFRHKENLAIPPPLALETKRQWLRGKGKIEGGETETNEK